MDEKQWSYESQETSIIMPERRIPRCGCHPPQHHAVYCGYDSELRISFGSPARYSLSDYYTLLVSGFILLHIEQYEKSIEYAKSCRKRCVLTQKEEEKYKNSLKTKQHFISFVPNDIKQLIIKFYYRFLNFNSYCNVVIMRYCKFPNKLTINSRSAELSNMSNDDLLYYGGKFISNVAINNTSNSKLQKIKIRPSNSYVIPKDGEFECIATDDYTAVAADGIDLIKNEKYKILQTSVSGWWYASAINNINNVGWVPSNCLNRNGICAIGITSNPKIFMNSKSSQSSIIPFNRKGIKSSIYWIRRQIATYKDGSYSTKSINFCLESCYIYLYIESNYLKIVMRDQTICTEKLENDIDYYFAMVFSVTPKQIVEYAISGDFI